MQRRRRRGRCASRLRHGLRGLLAFLFTNVGVVILVLGYTIAGSFMFQKIEGASEMERAQNMTLERDTTAHYLWENIALALNPYNETELEYRIDGEMRAYQKKVVAAVRRGWDGGRTSRQWSFSSAFLYCLTVITTIGYGHLTPRTTLGKITTIIYTLIGMPLFLLYLSNVGELLARWFKCVYALVCLCRGCPGFTRRRVIRLKTQMIAEMSEGSADRSLSPTFEGNHVPNHVHRWSSERSVLSDSCGGRGRSMDLSSDFTYVTFDAQTITVPISTCVAIMVGYILFGSMLFGTWESWNQVDCAYFCFISLSSIGFGDFVPGERIYTAKIETSFILCSMYLMLGMALVAMCFNLMQEQVIHYFSGLKRGLKRLCRCKR